MCPRVVKLASFRRDWLRPVALLWGAIVFIGHVATYRKFVHHINLPPDFIQHLTGIGVFSLLYRASWRPASGAGGISPTVACLLVCCSWGALCECVQVFVPLRDFQLRELALNTATPAVLIGLWGFVEMLVAAANSEQ
jgi:hypothetical protein